MAIILRILIILLYQRVVHVQSFSHGAPDETCEDMTPQHAEDPQIDNFPYIIEANATTVRPGDKINVTIRGDHRGLMFKGFLLQARYGDIPCGKFEPAPDVNIFGCRDEKENAATHTNAEDKSSISLVWVAPPKLKYSIKFTATIAKNGATYWVERKSKKIKVIRD